MDSGLDAQEETVSQLAASPPYLPRARSIATVEATATRCERFQQDNEGDTVRTVIGLLGIGIGLLLAGCTQSVDGTATSSTAEASTTTTTAAAPPPPPAAPASVVTADIARAALLKRSELGQILGDTDIKQISSYTKPFEISTGVEPADCASKLLFQEAISSSGYQAVMGDRNQGAQGTAAQLIQVFPVTAKDWPVPNRQALRAAGNVVSQLYDKNCREGVTFTTTAKDVTQHWTAGPVVSENPAALDDPRVDTARGGGGAVRQEAPARNCYHAVLARNNAMVQSIVCGAGDSQAQANQILDSIAAKLPAQV